MPAASTWNIEQSGMSTYYTSSSPFANDVARTIEPSAGSATDISYITHRIIPGFDIHMIVGTNNYCVHRNNNVAGDIKWQDGGTCIGAGVQLW